jgi:hypothetical protein
MAPQKKTFVILCILLISSASLVCSNQDKEYNGEDGESKLSHLIKKLKDQREIKSENVMMNLHFQTLPSDKYPSSITPGGLTPQKKPNNILTALPSESLVAFVSVNGNDTSANGSPLFPFRTIKAALDSINDASTTKRYMIKVGPGRFDESELIIKPWIWIKGEQRTATRVTSASGNMTLSSSFQSGNFRAGVSNLVLSGNANVDFNLESLGGSGSTVIELEYFYINNNLNFIGRTSADFIEARDCQILGNITVESASGLIFSGYIGSNVYISDETDGNVEFSLSYCDIGGSVTLNKTRTNTNFNIFFASNIIRGEELITQSTFGTMTTYSISDYENPQTFRLGIDMYIQTDSDSIPRSYVIAEGVTLDVINGANSIPYDAYDPSEWPSSVKTVKDALDYIITRIQ